VKRLLFCAAVLIVSACSSSVTTAGSVPPTGVGTEVLESAVPNTEAVAPETVGSTNGPSETEPASTVAVTPAPTTLAAPTTIAGPTIEASASGLGSAGFGDDAQETLAYFTEQFGAPGTDTGWGPNQSPCEDMGSRQRVVTWDSGVTIVLTTGPTLKVDNPSDHFSAYFVNEPFSKSQVVTINGVSVLGQSIESIQSQIAGISTLNSEIEGPVFVVNSDGNTDLSGTVGEDGIVQSVRAGLICID
jgi:hypothetical protein